MSLLQKLKTETSELHRQVEGTPLNQSVLSENFDLEDYKVLIRKNHQIHHLLEKSIRKALEEIDNPDIQTFFMSKLDWLYQDVQLLGINNLSLSSLATPAPVFKNASQLIGGLYVIEGSMLGGRLIHKAFQNNTHLKTIPEFYFFKNYGNQAGKRWRQFKQLAESQTTDPKQCVKAAKATFQFYKIIFET